MKSTRKVKEKRDHFPGKWFNGDELAGDVEFEITRSADPYSVRVRDGYDGEEADVFEIFWDDRVLSFARDANGI